MTKVTEKKKEEIKTLRSLGYTYKAVGEMVGIHLNTVKQYCDRVNKPNRDVVGKIVTRRFMLDEALKRGTCYYKDIQLPGGLTCPVTFDERAFGIGWEWDHVKGEKKDNISRLVTGGFLPDLEVELEKCVLTCCFHHRLKTFYDRGILDVTERY